jgi:probable aminopeptidase NPEPL1
VSAVVVGRAHRLLDPSVAAIFPHPAWSDMVRAGDPGDSGRVAWAWTGASPSRIGVAVLPELCSRHNPPSRAWAIPRLVAGLPRHGDAAVVLALDEPSHAAAAVAAVVRAFPTWPELGGATRELRILVEGVDPSGLAELAAAVRDAAALVDMPPNVLTPDALVNRAAAAAQLPGVSSERFVGDAARSAGLGGIWAVGAASVHPPAMVVLDWSPPGARAHVAWVGKGITYDTGGLALKAKTSMPGMKTDMGGAAAVLTAFEAVVRQQLPVAVTAVLCIAENAIGPLAVRPDDVITMFSGKTVEINNPDAEGRLVLGDGVAWVAKHRPVGEIVACATLTGAQGIATGRRHAAVTCSDADLEQRLVTAGLESGDTVSPVLWAPEFARPEFQSSVADLKNSVKDRNNAQPSCAAWFVAAHLPADAPPFALVDMAAPATNGGRATGYGPALLLASLRDHLA